MGITKSERFTILTFPHEEFAKFKAAIIGVREGMEYAPELLDFITMEHRDFINELSMELEKEPVWSPQFRDYDRR